MLTRNKSFLSALTCILMTVIIVQHWTLTKKPSVHITGEEEERWVHDLHIRHAAVASPVEEEQDTVSVDDLDLIGERPDTVQNWGWGPIPNQCQNKTYNISSDLKATVIMSFHRHENLTNVIRTVHSVVKRTPPRLLEGILLIDDGSQKGDEVTVMMNYLRMMHPNTNVRLLVMPKNVGLIRARLEGIREAKGPVAVILDGHMEVQEKWSEPLMQEIQKDRRTIAASVTDVLKVNGKVTPKGEPVWQYDHMASELRIYVGWDFIFGSTGLPDDEMHDRQLDPTQPVRTPVIIGCTFAIDKTFFEEVGAYDPGMEEWGGENIDLPIRVWLAGGQVYNLPCSHVAHIEYKDQRKYRKKQKSVNSHVSNYKRVAESLFGDYKKFFYRSFPEAKDMKIDVTDRLALVRSFPHDIGWFLENVYPQFGIPDQYSYAWDGPEHVETKLCLKYVWWVPTFTLSACDETPKQEFFWSKDGTLRTPIEIVRVLFDQNNKLDMEVILPVFKRKKNSKWIFWKGGPLLEQKTGLCMDVSEEYRVVLATCDPSRRSQRWEFKEYTADYHQLINGNDANIDRELYDLIRKRSREWSRDTETPDN